MEGPPFTNIVVCGERKLHILLVELDIPYKLYSGSYTNLSKDFETLTKQKQFKKGVDFPQTGWYYLGVVSQLVQHGRYNKL